MNTEDTEDAEDFKTNRFAVMWDINGLESIINISEGEQQAIIDALADRPIRWRNPIHTWLLRARYNGQRHYEIYVIEAAVSTEDMIQAFESDPQYMVDLIRARGRKLWGEPLGRTVIT
jgi:hypothetical protein